LRFIDHAIPHGTTRPIGLYEPLAQPLSPHDQQLWESAQAGYQLGDFEAAAQGFRTWLLQHAEDTAAKALLAQCERLVATPPTGPGTGVLTAP
jgi:hypothetical protein